MGSMAYKIAAFEVNNHELIRGICSTSNSYLSRNVTLEEMDNAVNIFEKFSSQYIILHTISSYPTKKLRLKSKMIHTLRNDIIAQ